MRPTRHSPAASRPRSGFRPLTVLATAFIAALPLAGCGDPLALQGITEKLLSLDLFGGSFTRLYSTSDNDAFYDVLEYQDVIHAVGTVYRQDTENDGMLLRIREDGSILNPQAFAAAGLGFDYNEHFRDIDVAREAAGGEDRLIVAGYRQDNVTVREGIALQLRVGGEGATVDKVSYLPGLGSAGQITGVGVGDEGFAAVGYSTVNPGETPIFAFVPFDSPDGTPDFVNTVDVGSNARFVAVRRADGLGGRYVAAGSVTTTNDVLLVGMETMTGSTADSESILQIDLGDEERVHAMDRIVDSEGNERFVIVGSTRAYDAARRWLVIIVTWGGSGEFDVERAMVVRPDAAADAFDTEALAVYGISRADNFWGRDNLFVVAGTGNQAVLMDIAGNIVWASQPGDDGILQGEHRGVTPNDDTGRGFYFAGINTQRNELLALEDASLAWALPEDGTSFPDTVPVQAEVDIVTDDLAYPPILVGTVNPGVGSGGTTYPINLVDNITVVESQ